MDQIGPWTRLERQRIYDNPWIRLSHDKVLRPNGSEGIYGVVHFKNRGLGVVALDSDFNVIMVGQHRYVFDEWTWEIPEGGGALFEDPLAGIQRELREETGYSGGEWHSLASGVMLSNSVSDERAYLWLAVGVDPGEACPDETEEIKVCKISFAEAIEWVMTGKIVDAMSIMALLLAEKKLQNLGIDPHRA